MKRILDVLIASTLLIVLFPLWVLIAASVKLDSPGPVLFVQDRIGVRQRRRQRKTLWDRTTFPIFKFRSMCQDADQTIHRDYIRRFCRGEIIAGSIYKLSNDHRVTRVGRLLRKTSLDELPQLLNVLRGEMSLVGPRPVPAYEVIHYRPADLERFTTLPGITGLWQIYGRGRVSFEQMLRMDIEYAHSCSLWLDIKILFLTLPAVLSRRGAR